MRFKIDIHSNNKLNPAFVKANKLILDKYADQICSTKDLEKFWLLEYGAILQCNVNDYIEFKDQKSKFLFSIKFQ